MEKFFKSLALSELYYLQIVNIQKEMDSKMYVLLIIIFGSCTCQEVRNSFLKKFCYIFCNIT